MGRAFGMAKQRDANLRLRDFQWNFNNKNRYGLWTQGWEEDWEKVKARADTAAADETKPEWTPQKWFWSGCNTCPTRKRLLAIESPLQKSYR